MTSEMNLLVVNCFAVFLIHMEKKKKNLHDLLMSYVQPQEFEALGSLQDKVNTPDPILASNGSELIYHTECSSSSMHRGRKSVMRGR